jgi:uncharacterized membrane protein YczE
MGSGADPVLGWRVTEPPTWRSLAFVRSLIRLNLGLALFGLGIATMLGAEIGLDPWSSFHEGISLHSGLSFGRITQLAGLVIAGLAWGVFRQPLGLGTLMNMAVIGPWVDLFRPWVALELDYALGVGQFVGGLGLVALASGLYITANLGAGPRDAFILGASRRFGASIRLTRGSIELFVLAIGFALGGPIGLGTIVFALAMGPAMQLSLRLFRYDNVGR